MTMDLITAIAELEENPDLHSARLLILLGAFAAEDGVAEIKGLTKLAKLDFLLRYPIMLEKALVARKKSIREVKLEEHERLSVESRMVRYRFGPWDHRYREHLNILAAKGLVALHAEGRTVVITLTDVGRQTATQIGTDPMFEPYVRRAQLLKRHMDLMATSLMKFIYETFPEVLSLRANEPIDI